MRLIDADAMIRAVEKESTQDGSYGYMDTKSIVDLINDAPTIEPERKKGRWIKMSDADGQYYCCSECGEELYRKWTFDREFDLFPKKESIEKTMYCPNCGADMGGEQK